MVHEVVSVSIVLQMRISRVSRVIRIRRAEWDRASTLARTGNTHNTTQRTHTHTHTHTHTSKATYNSNNAHTLTEWILRSFVSLLSHWRAKTVARARPATTRKA
jgi:hypothetical protein